MATTEIAIESEVLREQPSPKRHRRWPVVVAGVALTAAAVTGIAVAADDSSDPAPAVRPAPAENQAFDPLVGRYGTDGSEGLDPLVNRFGPGAQSDAENEGFDPLVTRFGRE